MQRATRVKRSGGYQFSCDAKERRDARDRDVRDAIGPQCHIIQWHVAEIVSSLNRHSI